MTHAIYSTLFVGNHTKSLAFLLIIKLGQYLMNLDRPWIKKHEVLLDIIYDFITFSPGFCIYLKTFLSSKFSKPIEETKKIFEAKQQQDITSNRILKSGLIENLDGCLKTTKKIVKKKRRLANAFKEKPNMEKQNSKIILINTFGNLGKKELSTSTLVPILGKDVKDVAIIDVDAYHLAWQLKRAQIFCYFYKKARISS